MGGVPSKASSNDRKVPWRSSIPDYFNVIPVELAYELLSFLDYKSLTAISAVNKLFYRIATDERIWKHLYQSEYDEKWMDFFSDRREETWSWRSLYKETRWLERRVNKESPSTAQHQKSIKLVVTGDNCAGQKTALLLAYFHNTCPALFYKGYVPAVFDNHVVSLLVVTAKETYSIQLSLWDTSGHEEFERLRPLQYANTNVFMVCFSIVKPETFQSVMDRWVPEIHHYCPEVPVLLVGLQKDLRNDPKTIKKLKGKQMAPISYEQGVQLANKLGVPYYECSADSGEGIVGAFRAAVKSVIWPNGKNGKSFFKSFKQKKEEDFLFSSGNKGPFKGKAIEWDQDQEPTRDTPISDPVPENGSPSGSPSPKKHSRTASETSNNSAFSFRKHTRTASDNITISPPFNLKKASLSYENLPTPTSGTPPKDVYMSETNALQKIPSLTSIFSSRSRSSSKSNKEKESRRHSVSVSAPTNVRHVPSHEIIVQLNKDKKQLEKEKEKEREKKDKKKKKEKKKEKTLSPSSSTASEEFADTELPEPAPRPAKVDENGKRWEEYFTEDGTKYWFHHESNESKWDEESKPTPKKKKKKKRMFGILLEKYYRRTQKPVPDVVVQTVLYLLEKGIAVKGIFRVPGSETLVKVIREKYEKSETVDLSRFDPHTVAGVLKLWLNECEEPLIPSTFKPQFYTAMEDTDLKSRNEKILELLRSLPLPHRETISLILRLLSKINQNSYVNEMPSYSLAVIMRTSLVGVGRKAAQFVQFLIENYPYFFEGRPKNLGHQRTPSEPHRRRTMAPQFPGSPQMSMTPEAMVALQNLPKHHSLPMNMLLNLNAMEMEMKGSLTAEEKLERRKSVHYTSPEKILKRKTEKPSFSPDSGIAKGIAFTFLVRCGENDFPTKVGIITDSMDKLRQHLCQRFGVPFASTILYLDSDFDEYIRLPDKIEDLPTKAKIVILNSEEEEHLANELANTL